MNKELLEKLRAAGFPESKCTHKLMHDENGCPFGWHGPNLEQLIEACGNGFANLEREDEGIEEGGIQWIAFKNNGDVNVIGDGGTGKTPTEAVARLWLALQSVPSESIDTK